MRRRRKRRDAKKRRICRGQRERDGSDETGEKRKKWMAELTKGLCPLWRGMAIMSQTARGGSGGREKEDKGNKETGRAMSNLEREVYVYIGEGSLCLHRRGKAMSNLEKGGLCPTWRWKVMSNKERERAMSTLEKETAMSDKEREGYVQTGEKVGVRSARKTRMR
jgi:hypothetical protein